MKMNMFEEHMLKKKTVRQVVGKSGRSLFYPLFKGVTWTYRPGTVQTLIFFRGDMSIFQWVVDGMMEWAIHKMI